MRVAKLILLLIAATAFTSRGVAEERSAPLDPISGFELRLLDKKFPVEITAGGKTEQHDAPIWVFMPETGQVQAPLGDITQPADLDGGTTFLPAPPDGFGLRALKLPIRESFILADGRQAIVEIPVFVYFRRVEAKAQPSELTPALSALVASVPEQTSTVKTDPAGKATAGLEHLRGELLEIQRQLSAIILLMDDGPARTQSKILVRQLDGITTTHEGRANDNPDGLIQP